MLQKKNRRRIEDVLGGLTVIRMGDGFKVRRTKGPKREKVLKSPEFENFRSTSNDFLQASRDSKTLRYALQESISKITDNRKHLRLNSEISKIFNSDQKTCWGRRSLSKCDPGKLQGFEFNGNNRMNHTFRTQYAVHIDRAAGLGTVKIPAFSPAQSLRVPQGATHCIIHAETAAVNFGKGAYHSVTAQSVPVDVTAPATNEIILDMPVGEAGNDPLFLTFGVYFVIYEHGVEYKLDNNSYSGLVLAAVDVAPEAEEGTFRERDSEAGGVTASTTEDDTLVVEEVRAGEKEAPVLQQHTIAEDEIWVVEEVRAGKEDAPVLQQHAIAEEDSVEANQVIAASPGGKLVQDDAGKLAVDLEVGEGQTASWRGNSALGETALPGEADINPVIASTEININPPQADTLTMGQMATEADARPDVWPDVPVKREKKPRVKEKKTNGLSQLGLFGDEPPPAN